MEQEENLQENSSEISEKKETAAGKSHSANREFLDWIIIIAIAFLVAWLLDNFIIVNAYIPSSSMVPTIDKKDRVIGLRTSYWTSSPKRGDIVIFLYPDNESENYIKRVIGEPGDKVEIRDGLVYINDSEEPLDEPYVNGVPMGDYGPYEVPEGCYFMLGDNRNNSKDSRFWNNTFVEEDKILAKAVVRYFPSPKLLK